MIALVPHCGYLSETSRMLDIYHALRRRGAQVRIASHGGTHENQLRVPYDIVEPRMDHERCVRFVQNGLGLGPADQSMYTDDELREHALAEAEYFREHGITVAVTGIALSTLLSTRLAGIKLVTEHAGSWVPPVLDPRVLELTWYCDGFNRVADELGVPRIPSLPELLCGDLTLIPEVPQVLGVPAGELGDRFRYTGPLFAHLDLPVPDRVSAFLDRPGPVVYVALTSTSPDLIRRIVRQLHTRVLVAGTVHDLADLAGDDVLVEGVLPSHLIMPRVDLAITTGGQGSVQTAMASGTPLLAVPLQPEQQHNIDLLHRLGAAESLDLDQVGTQVDKMLGSGSHRAAARRIQAWYDEVDGPDRAAEAIMEFAVAG
jgi:UDP:flavonoid glycosyltransferase YjiC (YdhE family)